MADAFLQLSLEDRREAMTVAADRSGRPANLLEKVAWVVWALAALYGSPSAPTARPDEKDAVGMWGIRVASMDRLEALPRHLVTGSRACHPRMPARPLGSSSNLRL